MMQLKGNTLVSTLLIALLLINAVTAQNAYILPGLNQQIVDLDIDQRSVPLSFLTAHNNVSNIHRGQAQSKYLFNSAFQVSIQCIILLIIV